MHSYFEEGTNITLFFVKISKVLWLFISIYLSRSSRLEVFCEKGVLRHFAKFTGNHLWQSLFFNKVAAANIFRKGLPYITYGLFLLEE